MADEHARATDAALARSVLYRALTLGLARPTASVVGSIGSPTGQAALRAAARLTDAASVLPSVDGWLDSVPGSVEDLAARYDRLFGYTVRGPVCASETEYGAEGTFQQPHQLANIAGYYRAFGLEPARGDLRVDHIACECEFMDFLCRKEALAVESLLEDPSGPWSEMIEETRKAMRAFLRDHLGRFGLAVGGRLAQEDPGGFYGRLGDVLDAFLGVECERLDVEPGPPTLALRPDTPDAVPIACDAAPELIQVRHRRDVS